MKRKTIKRLIFIPMGVIVLLIGIVLGGVAMILTPKRLTPLVSQLSDRYLDAQVSFDTVSLSLLRDFPLVTLRLRGTQVVSHAFATLPDSVRSTIPSAADTLARVELLDVSINPWSMIAGKVDIRGFRLEGTHVNAYVAPCGVANWDIYQDTTASDSESADLEININQIAIQEGLRVVYDSRPDNITATATLQDFTVQGRLSTNLIQNDIQRLRLRGCAVGLDIDGKEGGLIVDSFEVDGERQVDYSLSLSAKTMRWDDIKWVDSVKLRGGVLFHGKDHKDATISDFGLRINDMLLTANGKLGFRGDSITTDVELQTKSLKLASILNLIPTRILPLARDYETNLAVNLSAKIEGVYNPALSTFPNITADCRVPAGYLHYKKARDDARIDTLALDVTAYYRPQDPDSTRVDLRHLKVTGLGMDIEARGYASQLTGNALLNGSLKGGMSLDYLTRHFPSSDGTTVRGRIDMDINGRARLSQLNLKQIGSADLRGVISIDTLRVGIPDRDFQLMVGSGKIGLGVGTVTSDSSMMVKGTKAVGASFSLDTVNMSMGDKLRVDGRKLKIRATTATQNLVLDTTAIHPMTGLLSAAGLRVEMGDSTLFIGKGMQVKWSLLPVANNAALPRVTLDIRARRLSFIATDSRFVLRKGSVRFDLEPYQSLRSTFNQYSDGFTAADISSDLAPVLRRWELNGAIKAKQGRVITPYFPMMTIMRDLDITFNMNEFRLNKTFVKSGDSEMVLTGRVSGLRQGLLGSGTIQGDMKVEADTLNLNEIIRVANAGSALVAQGGGVGLAQESDEVMEQRITEMADTASVNSTLLVPSNIDMTFDMIVNQGAYANISLDSLSGTIIAKNRVLQLSNLVMRSNAGNIRMTGVYATPTAQDIQTGLDLEMDNMQIEQLIELIPSMDTLMPMLKSFEGVVDCNIALTARFDSAMNVLLPSITSACHLEGSNLEILDSKDFDEIAKMLMFKRKKENVIEHLSANILVRNSQVEVFPFAIAINRYRVAISGVNDLDMKFNYHISVLKSPVPFRMGVDIMGDMNDFDFDITRARYKSVEALPDTDGLIRDTRLNLQSYIRNVSQDGVQKTTDISALDIIPETQSPMELLPPSDSLSVADTTGLYKVAALNEE